MSVVKVPDYISAVRLLYDHSGYASSIIHHVKHHIVPALRLHHQFVDIGPGPGILTKAIGRYFEDTAVVHPQAELRAHFQTLGCTVIPESYMSYQPTNQADFILAAHWFYTNPVSKWRTLVHKMLNHLAPGGQLMIVINAPRGTHHELCLQLRPDYCHSGHLALAIEALGVPYTQQPNHVLYTTQTADAMSDICRFLITENCLASTHHASLTEEEHPAFEALVSHYAAAKETARGNYQLRQEEDWFFIQKR